MFGANVTDRLVRCNTPPVLSTDPKKRAVFAGVLLATMGVGTFAPLSLGILASVFQEDLGITRSQLGIAFAVNAFGAALLSPFVGRFTDRVGGKVALLAVAVLGTASYAVYGIAGSLAVLVGGSVLGSLARFPSTRWAPNPAVLVPQIAEMVDTSGRCCAVVRFGNEIPGASPLLRRPSERRVGTHGRGEHVGIASDIIGPDPSELRVGLDLAKYRFASFPHVVEAAASVTECLGTTAGFHFLGRKTTAAKELLQD